MRVCKGILFGKKATGALQSQEQFRLFSASYMSGKNVYHCQNHIN